jgi:hypothetical protein
MEAPTDISRGSYASLQRRGYSLEELRIHLLTTRRSSILVTDEAMDCVSSKFLEMDLGTSKHNGRAGFLL